jgi:diguanylate cyclase (GGDEF)-like protein
MFERATNDPLTGLPNNSYFLLQLAKVMRESTPEAKAGVLLLDLDAFKRVNLAAGAEMGDRALVDIANTLQDVLRADGLVARYGSDKFGILLPPDDGTNIAVRLRDVAERARAAIATKAYHGVQLSASIGGICFPGIPVESAPDLVAAADDALAKARAKGPGHVEIAT